MRIERIAASFHSASLETSEPIIIITNVKAFNRWRILRMGRNSSSITTPRRLRSRLLLPSRSPKPAALSIGRASEAVPRKKSHRPATTAAEPILIDTDRLAPTTNRYIGFMTQRLSHFFRKAAKRIGAAWIEEHGSDTTLKSANEGEDKPTDDPELERELLLFGAKLASIQRNSAFARWCSSALL